MTEKEWLESKNLPLQMLKLLQVSPSVRKSALFMTAYGRSMWQLLVDNRTKRAIEIVEQHVDGFATLEEVLASANEACEAVRTTLSEAAQSVSESASEIATAAESGYRVAVAFDPEFTAPFMEHTGVFARALMLASDIEALDLKRSATLTNLIRDIFGNPFRPVTLDPRWLTSTVIDLARIIYDERQWERMPMLADALMDAGCDSEEIIKHCQGPGPHVRGCWVVDLLTGRE